MRPRPGIVPNFLRARRPRQLRKKMFDLQVRLGVFIEFRDIQFSEGYWYAWYLLTIEDTLKDNNG